jgi:elongation factor P
MLNFNQLERGIMIVIDGQPYEILETSHMFKGRGHSVLQVKLKNLITGNVISRTFHPSDAFEEAEISKSEAKFIYNHRGKFVFSEMENACLRFELTEEQVGDSSKFLKANQIVEILKFKDKIINISIPIKIQLKVVEAPPGVKGERSEAGTKLIVLETGAQINAPLFIEQGDIIEINTDTNEYVRRVAKN